MSWQRVLRAIGAFGVVAIAVLVVACSDDPGPGAETPTEETLAAWIGESDGGVSALVVRDGAEIRAATGNANSSGGALSPESAFRVGSISKTFVATMVLQLVEEGKIDLDAPLGSYLPNAAVGGEVTIRDLLSHRSGIPNYTDQQSFFQDALSDPERSFTPAQILSYVDGAAAPAPRGTFSYSNTNYILLGQLVEDIDGVGLDVALRARITDPLGLRATSFGTAPLMVPTSLAGGWSGEVLQGDPDAPYRSVSSGAWSAGALISTTGDLRTFLEALFDGALISKASLRDMTDVGTERYGLGISRTDLGPDATGFGHSGGIPGYTSAMAFDPRSGDLVVVLTNNDELIADRIVAGIVGEW